MAGPQYGFPVIEYPVQFLSNLFDNICVILSLSITLYRLALCNNFLTCYSNKLWLHIFLLWYIWIKKEFIVSQTNPDKLSLTVSHYVHSTLYRCWRKCVLLSVFESELNDVIPVVYTSVAGCRIIGTIILIINGTCRNSSFLAEHMGLNN